MDLCWGFYTDPESDSFGVGSASAKKAGYSDETSLQITQQPWFQARKGKLEMLSKAEEVLGNMLEMDETDEQVFEGKPTGTRVRTAAIVKIKQDTAKYVTERLGKTDWSNQSNLDLTTGGERLTEEDTANLLKTLACGSTQGPDSEGGVQKEAEAGSEGAQGDSEGDHA